MSVTNYYFFHQKILGVHYILPLPRMKGGLPRNQFNPGAPPLPSTYPAPPPRAHGVGPGRCAKKCRGEGSRGKKQKTLGFWIFKLKDPQTDVGF